MSNLLGGNHLTTFAWCYRFFSRKEERKTVCKGRTVKLELNVVFGRTDELAGWSVRCVSACALTVSCYL